MQMVVITHVFVIQIEELLELDSAVGEGTERSPFFHLGRHGGVGDNFAISLYVHR